jgi:O-antigen/teichoic acid export membrane protein
MGVAGTIAKNTVFNFIATASDLLINFVVSIVLARILGAEQYGVYVFLMWFLSSATLIANLGLGNMAIRFIAEALGRQNRDEGTGIVQLQLTFRGLASLCVFVAILAFSGFWAKVFMSENNQIYFFIIAFAFLPNILNHGFISIFAGFQKYEYSAYLMLGSNPLRAIVVSVLAGMGFGIEYLLIANIAAWAVGSIIGIFLLRRLVPLKAIFSHLSINPTLKRSALKYAITVAGFLGINYFIWGEAAVLFLGLYCPVEEVGFYTLATKLPLMIMMIVPSVFGAVLLPAIAEQFGKGDMEKVKTIYLTSIRYLMIMALPLAAGGIVLAGPIVGLLYGADYVPVIILMQILFIPFVTRPLTQGAILTIQGINQPYFIFKVGVFLVCLNIGLNLWLIPRYGVLGAAIATSVPQLVSLPFYIRYIRNKIGASWPLIDTIKIALASAIMGLALFGLQTPLDTPLNLVVCIPLGIVIYIAAILALKVIRVQDLTILKEIQYSLPLTWRKSYISLIAFTERLT